MVKRLKGLSQWNRYFRGISIPFFLFLASLHPVIGQTVAAKGDQIEITEGKEQFMRTLASMPYASSGAGPVLYVLEYSDCSYCQAFEKEWKGKLDGVETRRLFYPVNQRSANETAYLARTRNINDFYAFMNRTKEAPDFKANSASIQAFNSVVEPLKNVLMPIMIKNGWPGRTPKSPQFMWETNGRVYASGGYSKESSQEMLNMVRSGAPAAQSAQAQRAPERPMAQLSETAKEGQGAFPIVDVIGIKLGISTIAETRAALGAVTPALRIMEDSVSLVGQSTTGRSWPIPNSDYVNRLSGVSLPANNTGGEVIAVKFSMPPGEGIALDISRTIKFNEGPTFASMQGQAPLNGPPLDTLRRSLVEKYGQPSFHARFDSGGSSRGPLERFTWVWNISGKLVPLNAQHQCVKDQPLMEDLSYGGKYSQSALQAGCAAVLRVELKANIGTADSAEYMEIQAVNYAAATAAIRKTLELINKTITQFEQEERAKSAKTAPPRL